MYLYIYTNTFGIGTDTHTHTRIYIYVHIYVHVCVYTYTNHARIPIDKGHMYTHAHARTDICTDMHTGSLADVAIRMLEGIVFGRSCFVGFTSVQRVCLTSEQKRSPTRATTILMVVASSISKTTVIVPSALIWVSA